MVNKKKAFKVAGLSALAIGAIHYVAHEFIAPMFPTTSSVILVGGIVVISVFAIGYYGMTNKE